MPATRLTSSMRPSLAMYACFLPPSPRGDTDLRTGRISDLLLHTYMERSNNTPPAANLVPKVAYSGGLCSSSFSHLKSARQLNSASYGSWDDNNYSVTSAKGGINVNLRSCTLRAPKHLSVHNSINQMVLFVLKRFYDAFACVKSMVPSYVCVVARILCSSASPNVRESECVSGRLCSESPIARTVSVFSSWKRIPRDTEFTENESQHHSDPGSYGKTSPTWIVSSAAPRHATGNRALLSDLVTKHGDMFVHAVDEMPMPVVAHGTAITDEINLPNVWLVPGLTANLVSICQLVEMDYSVEFGSGMCYIRNSSDGTIVGKAHLRKGGLYVLDFIKVPLGV